MRRTRSYYVAYVTADGERRSASVRARSHVEVERKVQGMGGRVTSIEREGDSRRRSSRSALRTALYMAVVFGIAVALVVAYWYRTH